jgi:26S proteasome regulatory subunit N13
MEALLNASSANNAENPSVVTLVKFPAGKLTKEEDSQRVVADPRSGIFQIVVNPEDALTHLQWRPRGVSTPEDDLIIFPGEAELVPVQSTPDRVFVLKWKEGSQRLFIWMQSADPDSDIVHVETVNHVLTEGPRGAQVG